MQLLWWWCELKKWKWIKQTYRAHWGRNTDRLQGTSWRCLLHFLPAAPHSHQILSSLAISVSDKVHTQSKMTTSMKVDHLQLMSLAVQSWRLFPFKKCEQCIHFGRFTENFCLTAAHIRLAVMSQFCFVKNVKKMTQNKILMLYELSVFFPW